VLLVVAVGTQNVSSLVAAYWPQPLKVKAAVPRAVYLHGTCSLRCVCMLLNSLAEHAALN
jgi:hypothetical protein